MILPVTHLEVCNGTSNFFRNQFHVTELISDLCHRLLIDLACSFLVSFSFLLCSLRCFLELQSFLCLKQIIMQ